MAQSKSSIYIYCLALTVTINVIESFVEAVHYTLNFNLRNKKIYGLVGPANMPYESIDLKKTPKYFATPAF